MRTAKMREAVWLRNEVRAFGTFVIVLTGLVLMDLDVAEPFVSRLGWRSGSFASKSISALIWFGVLRVVVNVWDRIVFRWFRDKQASVD